MSTNDPTSLNRRSLIAALSASAGAAMAGCLGDDDDDVDDDVDHGEPVEEVVFETMTGLPAASEQQQVAQETAGWLDELGVDVATGQRELFTFQEDLMSDAREQHLHLDLEPPFHQFLDSFANMEAMTAEKAGANAFISNTQYANCDYSNAVIDLAVATDEDEATALRNEALSIASEEVERINLVSTLSQSAYRTDQIDIERAAVGGFNDRAFETFWNAELLDANDIIMNVSPGDYVDVAYQSGFFLAGWTHYPFSPLTFYDLDNEQQGNLAESWEWNDEATTMTVDLREGQTFHNGEDILAEDIQWNYNWLFENAGALGIPSYPIEDIEVEDDHRFSFHFSSPSLRFEHFTALYGMVYPDQWIEAGAEEDPASPDLDFDNIIGSGPYVLNDFVPEEFLDFEPHPDHWADANTTLVFEAYADPASARRAFLEGEINVLQNMSSTDQDIIEDDLPDDAEVFAREDISDWYIAPQTNYGPTKFPEFREALSQLLDRQLIHDIMAGGQSATVSHSSILAQNNVDYPSDPDEVLKQIADDETGDIDRAREILEDEGWTWDSDGNLRYPEGADIDPLWPEGEGPADHADQWPCVDDLPP